MAFKKYVNSNCKLKCMMGIAKIGGIPIGSVQTGMNVTSQQICTIQGSLQATEGDKVLLPPTFGKCNITQLACVPILLVWQDVGKTKTINGFAPLLESSHISCGVGGVVSIADHGQKGSISLWATAMEEAIFGGITPKLKKQPSKTIKLNKGNQKTVENKFTGEEVKETKKPYRILKNIIFKRKSALWGAIWQDHVPGTLSSSTSKNPNGEDTYGHHWVELYGTESYGWWPASGGLDLPKTLKGVPGKLNGTQGAYNAKRSSATKDYHHGEKADEYLCPILDPNDSRSTADVANCIRNFAKNYATTHPYWAYPATSLNGENCHSFQEQMIDKCDISLIKIEIDKKGNIDAKNIKKRPNNSIIE